MKKILSLTLAALMVVSMVPTAFAAEAGGNWATGTNVTVTGDGGEYYVSVPATLEPGQQGTVRAYGKWAGNQRLVVTAPKTVEVTHVETGAATDVNVTFAGITSEGSDLEDLDKTASISIDKGNIRFGEWNGVIEYTVTLQEQATFTIDGKEYKYYDGITWGEWVNTSCNTDGFVVDASLRVRNHDSSKELMDGTSYPNKASKVNAKIGLNQTVDYKFVDIE